MFDETNILPTDDVCGFGTIIQVDVRSAIFMKCHSCRGSVNRSLLRGYVCKACGGVLQKDDIDIHYKLPVQVMVDANVYSITLWDTHAIILTGVNASTFHDDVYNNPTAQTIISEALVGLRVYVDLGEEKRHRKAVGGVGDIYSGERKLKSITVGYPESFIPAITLLHSR